MFTSRRNEREAFAALAIRKQQFGSDVVYIWVEAMSRQCLYHRQLQQGYVGTTPISGFTTSNQIVPMSANCTIKIVVGSNGLIKAWERDGNLAGASIYQSPRRVSQT